MFKLLEVFRDPPGQENVTSIAAIHQALRDVYPRAGDIGAPIYIDNAAHWPAIGAHAQSQFWVLLLNRTTDFERTFHWSFRAMVEDQRHAITGRNFEQAIFTFGFSEFVR
jgi:hypothetical protein